MIAQPSPRHLGMVQGLLEEVGTAGNLVNDAHLAALALEHHAEIVSFDGDFDRFRGVRRVLPRVRAASWWQPGGRVCPFR